MLNQTLERSSRTHEKEPLQKRDINIFSFNILDRYIGRIILTIIMQCLLMLVGLSAVIKYIEQLRFTGRGFYDLNAAFYYVLWQIPKDVEQFFPMAALLGALMGLGFLASRSELIVMQASGYSKLNITFSVLKTAIPMIFVVMLIGEWVSPYTEQYSKQLRSIAMSNGTVLSVRSSVWVKDDNSFIYIQQINADLVLENMTIWSFNQKQELNTVVYAKSAVYQPEHNDWLLHDVTRTYAGATSYKKDQLDQLTWNSSLSPEYLGVITIAPESLSLSGIYKYINYLESSQQDSKRYRLAFWRKIFQPLSVAVMMLLALSFIFGPLRNVTMGERVLTGVISGFIFYISNELFGPMTLIFKMPPILGATFPSIIFIILSIYLLKRKL